MPVSRRCLPAGPHSRHGMYRRNPIVLGVPAPQHVRAVLSMKAAPIQITSLGYGTGGSTTPEAVMHQNRSAIGRRGLEKVPVLESKPEAAAERPTPDMK